jgi:hypothetical protein
MKNFLNISFIILFLFHIKTSAQNDVQSVDGLMQKGQYSQALILLEKLNIGDSTQVEILQKQAFCNFKLGRFTHAKNCIIPFCKRTQNQRRFYCKLL